MPETIVDLGKRVKAKYPGQYDDMSDQDVGAKVKAKYPTEYADFTDVNSQFSDVQSGGSTANAPKGFLDLPSYNGASLRQIGTAAKGFLGLPEDLSSMNNQPSPSLASMLANSPVNPLFPVQKGAEAVSSLWGGIKDAPSNLISGDPYKLGQTANTLMQVLTLGEGVRSVGKAAIPRAFAETDPMALYRSATELRGPQSGNLASLLKNVSNANPGASAVDLARVLTQPVKNAIASGKTALADALIESKLAELKATPKEIPANIPDALRAARPATSEPFLGNAMERPDIAAQPYVDPAALVQSSETVRAPRSVPAEPYNPELFKPRPEITYPPEPPGPPDVSAIERALAPSGARAKLSTLRNAPKIAEIVPEVAGLPPGPAFDEALMQGFRRTEQAVSIAEDAVPRSTTVPKAPIVDEFKQIAADYRSRGLESSAMKVDGIIDKWDSMPDEIPWDNFIRTKRAFFREGGSSSAPLRKSYRVLMDASSKVSEDLSAANRSYSIVRRGLEDAKIDPATGRRIMDVGKSNEALINALKRR